MKNKLTCILFFGIIFIFSALCLILPRSDFSESERRELASFPEVTAESIFSGKFSNGFEEYSTDTFPFRDFFRGVKAFSSENIFLKSDNNKLFSQSGHLSKLDYPLSEFMLKHAFERFANIYLTYLENEANSVKFSLIPDKNYFLDTLKYDYDDLSDYVAFCMPYAEYIDIFPLLSLSDYYSTDSHWRQEKIVDVANHILSSFSRKGESEYKKTTLTTPFYGVYVGQAAKKVSPDYITYLTNDTLNSLKITSYDTGSPKEVALYDLKKAEGRDPYEMFLSGNSALLTIENPKRTDGSHLIVFRDSFGSSIVPLMAGAYEKITVVDIRYIQSEMLGSFIDFKGADVLYLYSTGMLNSSLGLR